MHKVSKVEEGKKVSLVVSKSSLFRASFSSFCFGRLGLAWLGLANSFGHRLAGLASARLYYTAPYRFSVSMFHAPVLIVHTCLVWAWLGLESQSYTLPMWVQQIPYNVPPLTKIRRPVHAFIHWLGLGTAGYGLDSI